MSNNSIKLQICLCTIKLSNSSIYHKYTIEMSNSSIWPLYRTLSGATTLGQNCPGSDGIEGILHIPQSSSITEVSPSDYFVSYPGHSSGKFYSWRDAVSVFCSPSWLGQVVVESVKGENHGQFLYKIKSCNTRKYWF